MGVQLLNNSLNYQKDLKFAIECSYVSTPLNQTNRHRKMEFGNSLEILENNQSYEI